MSKDFEFFGGVSRDLIYDNLKTAVKEGWGKQPGSRIDSPPFELIMPTVHCFAIQVRT